MNKIRISFGIAAIIFAVSAFSFRPPSPGNCLVESPFNPDIYQLVITGACYYNLQLQGDVRTCNQNEPGICMVRWCDINIEGCTFHPYEDPIEI